MNAKTLYVSACKEILNTLRYCWRKLPTSFRRALSRTGVPYTLSFISTYKERHEITYFAGALEQWKSTYNKSSSESQEKMEWRLDGIVDRLVMPNGVKKTTYANRLSGILTSALSVVKLEKKSIRVLELPSSSGSSSIDNINILEKFHALEAYVLGDLFHEILYDPQRQCVFDAEGNLLQVALGESFFSIYKGHENSNEVNFISWILLFPHSVIAWWLKHKYRLGDGDRVRSILVMHPKIERLMMHRPLRAEVMNVFSPVNGQYDLILSFNLLQRNYFPTDVIAVGIKNLERALDEGGLLILGDTNSFLALQKENGRLVCRLKNGELQDPWILERLCSVSPPQAAGTERKERTAPTAEQCGADRPLH